MSGVLFRRSSLICAGLLAGSAMASPLAAPTVRGAGATFPYPIYAKWFDSYAHRDAAVSIGYDAIGSEAGVRVETQVAPANQAFANPEAVSIAEGSISGGDLIFLASRHSPLAYSAAL